MAPRRALTANAEYAGVKAYFVVQYQHVFRRNFIECRRLADCLPGIIHISHRLHKKHSYTAECSLCHKSVKLRTVYFNAKLFGNIFYGKESGVMTGTYILRTGVSESCNYMRDGESRFFFLYLLE